MWSSWPWVITTASILSRHCRCAWGGGRQRWCTAWACAREAVTTAASTLSRRCRGGTAVVRRTTGTGGALSGSKPGSCCAVRYGPCSRARCPALLQPARTPSAAAQPTCARKEVSGRIFCMPRSVKLQRRGTRPGPTHTHCKAAAVGQQARSKQGEPGCGCCCCGSGGGCLQALAHAVLRCPQQLQHPGPACRCSPTQRCSAALRCPTNRSRAANHRLPRAATALTLGT